MTTDHVALIRRTLDAGGCTSGIVSVSPLASFENHVFLVRTAEEARPLSVVRISRPGERSLEEVRAELAFVDFLADAGIEVARPLSPPADLGGPVGAWFRYIEGGEGSSTAEVMFALGRVMGRMHTAAERAPPELVAARPGWWEAESLRLELLAEAARPDVLKGIRRYFDDVRRQAAGELLVHGDLGLGNVVVGSTLHVIDFDDCCRAEPEYDLAVVLIRLFTLDETSPADVERTVPALIAGYRGVRDRPLSVTRLDRYARVLLLQSAIVAVRRPGWPGLTAHEAVERAWAAIGGERVLPETLRLALDRVAGAVA